MGFCILTLGSSYVLYSYWDRLGAAASRLVEDCSGSVGQGEDGNGSDSYRDVNARNMSVRLGFTVHLHVYIHTKRQTDR